jgi:hypothetical protein
VRQWAAAAGRQAPYTDFENFTTCKPGSHLEQTATIMLDQVIAWSGALKPLRAAKSG